MSKIKSFFCSKASLLSMAFLGILMTVGCLTVCASSYVSTLYIGNGSTVAGSVRYYTAGDHKIMIGIDSWTNYASRGYTNVYIDLVSDDGNLCVTLGSKTMKVTSANVSKTNYFGQQSAGDKYYLFKTKNGSTVYGGIKSSNVVMTS